MRILQAALPVAFCLAIPIVRAQDRQSATNNSFYQVKFTIQDNSDPTAKAVRQYTMVTAANRKAVFKVGDRVPLATTAAFQPATGGTGINPIVNTQFTYLDVGVTIECLVADAGGKIAMHGNIDLSTVERHEGRSGGQPNPTVGQTRIELDTAVNPGKPEVVAAIDDPVNMRKLEVQATVTKLD